MTDASYGITRNLGTVDFGQALERVTAALKTEGFGVLTEIDVRATLKKKIDVEFPNYKILGACNPPLAHGALLAEPMIGLLLPCNVIVFEEQDGTTTVSAVNPTEMFKVVNNEEMAGIAGQVEEKIRRAIAAV